MGRAGERLTFIALGVALGGLGTLNWPFGVSERDVAKRLVEHRESRGGVKVDAACHERPDSEEYYCEAKEAAGRESPGYGEYIVRRRGDDFVFDRLPTVR